MKATARPADNLSQLGLTIPDKLLAPKVIE
jgi:hypothetical protein